MLGVAPTDANSYRYHCPCWNGRVLLIRTGMTVRAVVVFRRRTIMLPFSQRNIGVLHCSCRGLDRKQTSQSEARFELVQTKKTKKSLKPAIWPSQNLSSRRVSPFKHARLPVRAPFEVALQSNTASILTQARIPAAN
jgi:hypothetical protein